jgi:tetratricopeptide (TPR) repeat protein
VSDLLISALSALLATNQPAALSNLVQARTGIVVPVTDPNEPVEKEYHRVLEIEDAAEQEVNRWIAENDAFTAKGGGVALPHLEGKIRARYEPARKAYEAFLAAHPAHARGRLAYGGFLSDTGDEEGALTQWEKARDLDPKNPVPWNNLANFYGHNGPITNAFHCYAQALALKPTESLYYQKIATTVFLFRKDAREFFHLTEAQVFDKAMGLYRQARALDPDNFLLATDLAQSYYGMKKPKTGDAEASRRDPPQLADEALAAWQDALQIAPDENARQGVLLHRVRWQINAERFDQARRTLELITNSAFAGSKRVLEKNLAKREAATNTAPGTVEQPAPGSVKN